MKGLVHLLLALTAGSVAASPLHDVQTPLALARHGAKVDLIDELKKAEIIPQILDDFVPQVTIAAFWDHATAEVGNTVNPDLTQKKPNLQLMNHIPDEFVATTRSLLEPGVQLTVALTDPDAPSRDDPKWSQICHWIATNVSLTGMDPFRDLLSTRPNQEENDLVETQFSKGMVTIMPYNAPGPPPKTGKHRYIFVALAPKNGTTETLSLVKPSDRQYWGYGKEGKGVRNWAEEMGLIVVGANFVYAQNKKQ
ncbi:carboxypeptidase Y inhibitor [Recurvomyces mirabilis]|nr:carboxypeptidase Y inhibitor [Recurvomyces mirabilis]